uniref:Uncharacterized protein n=1 Tax=Setaria italica TaxID=4555 RepID=K3ZZ28_SETIT
MNMDSLLIGHIETNKTKVSKKKEKQTKQEFHVQLSSVQTLFVVS